VAILALSETDGKTLTPSAPPPQQARENTTGKCTYNVILRRVRASAVAVEKQ
jgi:hypothetical protein